MPELSITPKSSEKTVGIIGGMGPEATVELMQRIIKTTPAQDDTDHIHMLVDNNPKVPSRLKALLEGSGDNPGPVIATMAQRLEAAGADFLVIPCNTAHHYHAYAQDAVHIPVWHLIELSLLTLKSQYPQMQHVGLLASEAVQNIQLFEPYFSQAGIELIYPTTKTQATVMQVIRAVKAGNLTAEQLLMYNQQIAEMKVDGLLLGCSELSVLWPQHQQTVDVVDSLQILAEEIVHFCIGYLHE